MITLDVQPYCENCPAFDPDVTKNKTEIYGSDGSIEYEHTTIIYCTRRKTCEGIKRYLEKEAAKGDLS